MKILTISNYYPPHYLGGYELACQDVVEGLRLRGHTVAVLTSDYGIAEPVSQGQVYRRLRLHRYAESQRSLWQFAKEQYRAIRNARRLIRQFQPDLLHIWSMGFLGHPLIHELFDFQDHGCPLVFAISDRWMFEGYDQSHHWRDYWQYTPQPLIKKTVKRLLKHLLSQRVAVEPLRFPIRYAHFFSQSLQRQYAQAGIFPHDARIIYHGVPIPPKRSFQEHGRVGMKLLYSGRLDPQKGVHTAIEAMAALKQHGVNEVHLTILGQHEPSEYVAFLLALIERHALHERVSILKKMPREELSAFYQTHDALLFPSIWEEPFSITLLEAMSHGLIILSTATGGSSEILRDQENCLIFKAANADELACKIEETLRFPQLAASLRKHAYDTVRMRYSREKMIDEIEQYLLRIAQRIN